MGILDRFRGRTHKPPREAARSAASPSTAPSFTSPPVGSLSREPRFAVIDVETTGLSAEQHRVVEIAVVTTDLRGHVLDEWSTRINPQGPVGATHIHGITDADVRNAPEFADLVGSLTQRLVGAAVVAHHARFDLAFLRAEYRRAAWDLPRVPALCTLQASSYHLPTLDRRRLADCCWAIGSPLTHAHSALGDARATASLLAAFMHPRVGLPPLEEHLQLPQQALDIVWPTRPTLSTTDQNVAPTRGNPRRFSDRALHQMAQQAASAPATALVELVERFSLVDALDEGAPPGALAYLEKLAEVLEDGEVTAAEASELAEVAETEELTAADLTLANRAFALTLAHAALEDGKVSRAERAELMQIAELLGVDSKLIPALLDTAGHARHTRLSIDLKPLPADWAHGDSLRVGDKIVFTGCEERQRDNLEARSNQLGVRVLNTVSAKAAMLVTDGTMEGCKASRARELNIRTVHPDVYTVMLEHIQPALPRDVRQLPKMRPQPTGRHKADLMVAGGQQDSGEAPRTATVAAAAILSAPASAIAQAASPAQVRAWARQNGWEVGVRGRLQGEVLDAYSAAHPEFD